MRDRLGWLRSGARRPAWGFPIWEWRIACGGGMMFPMGEGLRPWILRRRSAMQITLHRAAWVAGILVAAALTPAAQAQGLGRVFVTTPTVTTIRVQTTVTVPDGGTALVGGTS